MEAIDELIESVLIEAPAGFDPAETPAIAVSAAQGKFLALLTRALGARRVLELGTLAGYSTLWFAGAVGGGGEVATIELNPDYAAVARANLERAGVADRVHQYTGPALEILPTLAGPFDLAFLDADKATMDKQLELIVPLMRTGGVIICDNVVRGGAILAPADASAAGSRAVIDALAADPRLDATVLQTVGAKGHDGFAFALVA